MVEEIIETAIKKNYLIEPEDKVIVGVSGGPDSICLLDNLRQIQKENTLGYPFSILVAHIQHGLRKEADEDMKYVQDYCTKNEIPCFIKKVSIQKIAQKQRIGTEEAGRIVRYEFFQEILKKEKANKIAIAHSANDNAETILLNLLRGCGVSGLQGMQIKRQGIYIRPLLQATREEIEEYCERKKLKPRIDKTNAENIYTRNKVRNLVIPLLKQEFNPNIITTLNRLAQTVQQEEEYWERVTKETYQKILIQEQKEQIMLDLEKFNKQELVIKNRLVLYTMNRLFKTKTGIEKIHIKDIITLCERKIGNKFLIPNKKVKILVKNKKIFFMVNRDNP